MKRWLVLSAIVGSLVGSASFLACGGGDDSVAAGDGGSDDGTLGTGDDGGSSTGDDGGGGGGNDGSTATDGSKSEGGGGGGSNPGQISCGATSCSTSSQSCCERIGDAGPNCIDAGTQCQGLDLTCDEAADCADGGLCCLELGLGRSRCRATCNGPGRYTECKTSADCGDAGTCTAYSCQGGIKVMTCKKPPGCN